MPVNKHGCDKEVRSVCIAHKCSKCKHKNVSGKLLNTYFHQKYFSVDQSYQICSVLDMRMNCTYTTSQPEVYIDGGKPLIEQEKVIEKDDSDDEPIDLTRNSKTSFFDKKLRDTIVTKSYRKTFRDLNSTSRNNRGG